MKSKSIKYDISKSSSAKTSILKSISKEPTKPEIIEIEDDPIECNSSSKMSVSNYPKMVKTDLYEISTKSLDLLKPTEKSWPENWLNDEIINAYIDLINQRIDERDEKSHQKSGKVSGEISIPSTKVDSNDGCFTQSTPVKQNFKKQCFFNTYAYPKLKQLNEEK